MSAGLVMGRGNSRVVLVSQPARADRVQMDSSEPVKML